MLSKMIFEHVVFNLLETATMGMASHSTHSLILYTLLHIMQITHILILVHSLLRLPLWITFFYEENLAQSTTTGVEFEHMCYNYSVLY